MKATVNLLVLGVFLINFTDFLIPISESSSVKISFTSKPDNGKVYLLPARNIGSIFLFKRESGGVGTRPILITDSLLKLSNVTIDCIRVVYYEGGRFHSYQIKGTDKGVILQPYSGFTEKEYKKYQIKHCLLITLILILLLCIWDWIIMRNPDLIKRAFAFSVFTILVFMYFMYQNILW